MSGTQQTNDHHRYESILEDYRPSSRAIIVLLYWTYFETRLERLYRDATPQLRSNIVDHLLDRNTSVARRMDQIYDVVFSGSYLGDLNELGFGKSAEILRRVQKARNLFMHGQPHVVDDRLVEDVILGLKDEHEGWISVYNKQLKTNYE